MLLFKIKELLDMLALPLYIARGRRPWTPGYYTEKRRTICSAIRSGLLRAGKELPPGYGLGIDERVVEYPWVFAQLTEQPGKVLDAGSALNHGFLLGLPPLSNANLTIMTLAPEKRCFWDRSISYVFGDLRRTDFADGTFDMVISVSTVEHIGLDNTQLYTNDASKKESDSLGFVPAIREFRRLLKPGGTCLVTVPFGRSGIYGWYQVFDAGQLQRLIDTFQPKEYIIDYFGYDARGWHRATANELAEATFYDVHSGAPYQSDLAAGARGLACVKLHT